jgi:hypothetical protein
MSVPRGIVYRTGGYLVNKVVAEERIYEVLFCDEKERG